MLSPRPLLAHLPRNGNDDAMTQAKTSQPSSVAAAGTGMLQLWHWWSAELTSMLPASIASWIDGDTVATNVTVDEHAVTILSAGAGATKSSPQRVPLDTIANSAVLRALIAAGRDRVRLVLSADQALVKTITLPLATEENLREVVGFELDRHTPFTPDQAYYDVQIVKRDPQQEQIVVSLAVASKSEVTALVGTLRRAGLSCAAVGINDGTSGNATSFDLQPAGDKPARRLSRTHQINLGLLGLVVALTFAAIILPIWQKREAVKLLLPQAGKSSAEFLISERVYTEYTKLIAEYNFLATRKHAVYPALAVLEELARTFPETTWVQKLDIKVNGKVREVSILGEAQSASKVIENLEQSPLSLFQNSKQLTQTYRMTPSTERFHVSAEIKPRPVPAAVSIDEVVAPAAPVPVSSTIPSVPSATPASSTNPAATTTVPTAVVTPVQQMSASAPVAPPTAPPPPTSPAAKASVAPGAPSAKRSGS